MMSNSKLESRTKGWNSFSLLVVVNLVLLAGWGGAASAQPSPEPGSIILPNPRIKAPLPIELDIRIGHELPMSEAVEAHRMLEGRATTGKVVLTN